VILCSTDSRDLSHRVACDQYIKKENLPGCCRSYEMLQVKMDAIPEDLRKVVLKQGEKADKLFVLITQYCEGKSLHDLIMENAKEDAVLLLSRTIQLMKQLHSKKFYHLDLKPMHIIRQKSGEPVLIDFGLSYFPGCDMNVTVENDRVFSNCLENRGAYAAKMDVFNGHIDLEKFDVYSLGSILYEIVTGKILESPLKNTLDNYTTLCQLSNGRVAELLMSMAEADQNNRCTLESVTLPDDEDSTAWARSSSTVCVKSPTTFSMNLPEISYLSSDDDNISFSARNSQTEPRAPRPIKMSESVEQLMAETFALNQCCLSSYSVFDDKSGSGGYSFELMDDKK